MVKGTLQFTTHRAGSRAVLFVCSLMASGCTFIGAGIGAGIDSAIPGPYEYHPVTERVPLKAGDRLRIKLRNGIPFDCQYVGFRAPVPSEIEGRMVVETEDDLVSLRPSEVREVGIEVVGHGWLYGGLVGLAADTTVVIATIISVRNMRIQPFGNGPM